MAVKCDHMPEVSCGKCDGWAEVERLEAALAALEEERSNQVKRAEAAEADLRHSDAIRAAMISAASGTARDMVRCLELLEAAFHAGAQWFRDEAEFGNGIDEAYREWVKEHLNNDRREQQREPKPSS